MDWKLVLVLHHPLGKASGLNDVTTLFQCELLATAVTLYQILHPQAPTPPQIVEIFNQTYNVVNQTTVVNPPPAAGAG
ncbi:hypothetical protein [Mycobacterium sp.]|uniref:hypothetical protein n=1 Tax=Mycobacterium sp. TaxID=1785 RepID=UPI003F9C3F2C